MLYDGHNLNKKEESKMQNNNYEKMIDLMYERTDVQEKHDNELSSIPVDKYDIRIATPLLNLLDRQLVKLNREIYSLEVA